MQVPNPSYRYYQKFKGVWKSDDGACTAEFTEHGKIMAEYGGARLESYYDVSGIDPLDSMNPQPVPGLMEMAGFGEVRHPGECMRFHISNRTFYDGDKTLYSLTAWYTFDAVLKFELMDLNDGGRNEITMKKEETVSVPDTMIGSVDADGSYHCGCGYVGPASKFCPECGKMI
ncbi:hypothetical protein SAMN02910456_01097 [Ruminococcaceae bacterium YRB3002]|nr:hypothetical protein SAMN02910456_01097 [Ruminococcaceae bacterium YRB3002]